MQKAHKHNYLYLAIPHLQFHRAVGICSQQEVIMQDIQHVFPEPQHCLGLFFTWGEQDPQAQRQVLFQLYRNTSRRLKQKGHNIIYW